LNPDDEDGLMLMMKSFEALKKCNRIEWEVVVKIPLLFLLFAFYSVSRTPLEFIFSYLFANLNV